jgi:hypothetical protein
MTKKIKKESLENITLQNNVIDKYYNEDYDKDLINKNSEATFAFEEELASLSDNMDITLDEVDIDVNILAQLVKAEEIKGKKEYKLDLILFLFFSLLLVSVVVITCILNPSLIKYFIGIAFFSPIAIIPVSIGALKGSDSYE